MKIKLSVAAILALMTFTPVFIYGSNDGFDVMEKKFSDVPHEQPIAVYWYWIDGNISEDGVVKDLHAMKDAGINRVQIGMIGDGQGAPRGPVRMFTRQWWKILHTMFKTATELDIEVGLFNCPGWSQSGGPWVEPEQSMRYLASVNDTIQGPAVVDLSALRPVGDDWQDVSMLAYPLIYDTSNSLVIKDLYSKKEVIASSEEHFVARSIVLYPEEAGVVDAELSALKGGEWTIIDKYHLDRSNTQNIVGFVPFAPFVFSLPEIEAEQFRLIFSDESFIGKVEILSEHRVELYAEKTLAKMWPYPLPMWDAYMWRTQPDYDAQVLQPEQVIDITPQKGDTFRWNVPDGKWVISRKGMLPTGVMCSPAPEEGRGLETDKMSKEHIRTHFNNYLGKILEKIPAEDRRTFRIVVEDSYETGGQNWTDGMEKGFKAAYGYDPIPYLPVLEGVTVGSNDESDRFLWDLRRYVADKVAYEYVAGLREASHEHGLTTWLENYGHWGFPGEFLQYGGQSDEIAGEFWSFGNLGDIENKAASSCGHIYGKDKVWAESCTCGGSNFDNYPATMKQRIDRFFTEGINATLLHLYIQQPDDRKPGINAWFGNEFNRNNTWFSQMDIFVSYLKRCNYMLQQGRYVADVAYFIGEDAPKMTGVRNPEVPEGYSYDYINAEVLMGAKARDEKLVLESGMEYSVLVLPKIRTMRPELLAKIRDLVKEGVVIQGPAPECSPSLENYPEADKTVKKISDEMWGTQVSPFASVVEYGDGLIYKDASIEQIMNDLNLGPDFRVSDPELPVLFIHLTSADGDVYFISNQSEEKISFDALFRVKGKQPELWNPLTGDIRILPQFENMTEAVSIPMELEPLESSFVVFRSPAEICRNKMNYPQPDFEMPLSSTWTISFDKAGKGPARPVTAANLFDWAQSSDRAIRNFSGTAIYRTTFNMDSKPASDVFIDLGKVMVMAKVRLNGKDLGGVWTYPYRVNVADALEEGENVLEIEVVNCWRNRIIGDLSVPKNQRITVDSAASLNIDSELQSSGLMGPVRIVGYPYSK